MTSLRNVYSVPCDSKDCVLKCPFLAISSSRNAVRIKFIYWSHASISQIFWVLSILFSLSIFVFFFSFFIRAYEMRLWAVAIQVRKRTKRVDNQGNIIYTYRWLHVSVTSSHAHAYNIIQITSNNNINNNIESKTKTTTISTENLYVMLREMDRCWWIALDHFHAVSGNYTRIDLYQ